MIHLIKSNNIFMLFSFGHYLGIWHQLFLSAHFTCIMRKETAICKSLRWLNGSATISIYMADTRVYQCCRGCQKDENHNCQTHIMYHIESYLSGLGYSELIQGQFENIAFFPTDPLFWFCKDTGPHYFCWAVHDSKIPVIHFISNEEISLFDVFWSN